MHTTWDYYVTNRRLGDKTGRTEFFVTACRCYVQYEIMFVVFPIIGILTGEPLFSGYALFEICSWKGSKTVIDGKLSEQSDKTL
jgi:hypothetical protein